MPPDPNRFHTPDPGGFVMYKAPAPRAGSSPHIYTIICREDLYVWNSVGDYRVRKRKHTISEPLPLPKTNVPRSCDITQPHHQNHSTTFASFAQSSLPPLLPLPSLTQALPVHKHRGGASGGFVSHFAHFPSPFQVAQARAWVTCHRRGVCAREGGGHSWIAEQWSGPPSIHQHGMGQIIIIIGAFDRDSAECRPKPWHSEMLGQLF